MRFTKLLLLIPLLALVFVVGCSNDDDPPTGPGDYTPLDSTWTSGSDMMARLDATDHDAYKYFNLMTGEVVDISNSEAATNNGWHVAFKRETGKLNGGASGALGVKGVNLAMIGDPNGMDFDAVTAATVVADSLYAEDAINLVFDPYYSYDFNTHSLVLTHNLFAMKDAGGAHVKVVVDSMMNAGMSGAELVFKYVRNNEGTTDLSGATEYATLDATSGEAFLSFTEGQVDIADPATSTAWDIWIHDWDARVNGGIHGSGNAKVYPLYLETNNFDSLQTAPGDGTNGYFADSFGSIFGSATIPESAWYDYNPVVHELESKGYVYIVMLPTGERFKLVIENYYLIVDEEPVSGWYTIKYAQL